MSGAMLLTTTGHHPKEEPVWDCLVCGVHAIAASLEKCPGCHAVRGAEKPAAKPAAPVPAAAPATKAAPAVATAEAEGAEG